VKRKLISNSIFKKFKRGQLDEVSFTNFLITNIELNNQGDLRAQSIEYLRRLKIRSPECFNFLENILISDESPLVRVATVKALLSNFPDKSIKPIKWIIQNDKTYYINKLISDYLIRHPSPDLKQLRREIDNWLLTTFKVNLKEARVLLELMTLRMDVKEKRAITFRANKGHVNSLNIFGLSLKTLPRIINELKKIIELNIRGNDLQNDLNGIEHLKKLTMLDLNNNNLHHVPKCISKLKHLTDLNLSRNNIEELPKFFSNLKNLVILDLNQNKFKEIPLELASLPNLKHLDLEDNSLAYINEFNPLLSRLESLRLNNLTLNGPNLNITLSALLKGENFIKAGLNFKEARAMALLEIHLGAKIWNYARLKDLEEHVGFFGYQKNKNGNVVDICLMPNNSGFILRRIPEKIKLLENLKSLKIVNLKVENVPETIGDLKNLEILDLSSNKIKKLPDSIGLLSSLKELNVNNNLLLELPQSISLLKNLNKIDLKNNNLKNMSIMENG